MWRKSLGKPLVCSCHRSDYHGWHVHTRFIPFTNELSIWSKLREVRGGMICGYFYLFITHSILINNNGEKMKNLPLGAMKGNRAFRCWKENCANQMGIMKMKNQTDLKQQRDTPRPDVTRQDHVCVWASICTPSFAFLGADTRLFVTEFNPRMRSLRVIFNTFCTISYPARCNYSTRSNGFEMNMVIQLGWFSIAELGLVY